MSSFGRFGLPSAATLFPAGQGANSFDDPAGGVDARVVEMEFRSIQDRLARERGRVKRKKWLLTLALMAATGGCAGIEDCRYETAQRLRAAAEYHKCGAPACERYPKDYKRGYLDGFYAISTGGPCCPPAVAPAKYYRVANVLGERDNPRHSYYSGWQDGSARASMYPDTHYLRLFETCECSVPRCQGCGPQGVCLDGGSCGKCGSHLGVGDGLIHGAPGDLTPIIDGNDPIYGGAHGTLPETIVTPLGVNDDRDDDQDDDRSGDRSADRQDDTEASSNDSDGDDTAPPAPTDNRSSDRDADSDDEMDLEPNAEDADVLSPSDIGSEANDVEDRANTMPRPATQDPRPDGQSLGLHRGGSNDALIPIEGWDAGLVDSDFKVGVVRNVDAGGNPARVTLRGDRSIAERPAPELATDKIATDQARLASAPVQPLDRGTIQALFGIDEMFAESEVGVVAYQNQDPSELMIDEDRVEVDHGKNHAPTAAGSRRSATPEPATVPPNSDASPTVDPQIAPLILADPPVREAAFDPAST